MNVSKGLTPDEHECQADREIPHVGDVGMGSQHTYCQRQEYPEKPLSNHRRVVNS